MESSEFGKVKDWVNLAKEEYRDCGSVSALGFLGFCLKLSFPPRRGT